VRHYSIRTEQAYVHWVKRYIIFHGKRHPGDMGPNEIERFLTWLAVQGKVSASTQGQALAALLFLYKQLLSVELPWLDEVASCRWAKRSVPTRIKQGAILHSAGETLLGGCIWLSSLLDQEKLDLIAEGVGKMAGRKG